MGQFEGFLLSYKMFHGYSSIQREISRKKGFEVLGLLQTEVPLSVLVSFVGTDGAIGRN